MNMPLHDHCFGSIKLMLPSAPVDQDDRLIRCNGIICFVLDGGVDVHQLASALDMDKHPAMCDRSCTAMLFVKQGLSK